MAISSRGLCTNAKTATDEYKQIYLWHQCQIFPTEDTSFQLIHLKLIYSHMNSSVKQLDIQKGNF